MDTGVGNPEFATKEKEEDFYKVVVKEIVNILEELYHINLKNMYE